MLERTVEIALFSEIIVFSTLGVLGSLFMILSFFISCCCYKSTSSNNAKYFSRMVLYLGIGDLILSIAIIFSQINYGIVPNGGYNPNSISSEALCKAQAFLVLFTQVSKLLWLFSFSVSLFLQVILVSFSNRLFRLYSSKFIFLEIGFHIVNWGVPFLISLTLLFTNRLGKSFIGCWITNSTVLPFAIYYGPLILVFFFTLLMYILVIIVVTCSRRKIDTLSKPKISKLIRNNKYIIQLSTYLLVFLILWTPAVVGTLHNNITGKAEAWMLYPQFIWTLTGFLDGIVYSIKKNPKTSRLLTCCCIGLKSRIPLKRKNLEKVLEDLTDEISEPFILENGDLPYENNHFGEHNNPLDDIRDLEHSEDNSFTSSNRYHDIETIDTELMDTLARNTNLSLELLQHEAIKYEFNNEMALNTNSVIWSDINNDINYDKHDVVPTSEIENEPDSSVTQALIPSGNHLESDIVDDLFSS